MSFFVNFIDCFKRKADVILGADNDPYLYRWHIIPRNRYFNIYLHKFLRSDDDRAIHDHPWCNVSFLLTGAYIEHKPKFSGHRYPEITDKYMREKGSFIFRRATDCHRIELLLDEYGKESPVWTIFITGPKVRDWGFICPKGWVPWEKFTKTTESGNQIGLGCDALEG